MEDFGLISLVQIVPGGGAKVKGAVAFSLNDRIDPENPFISYEVRETSWKKWWVSP